MGSGPGRDPDPAPQADALESGPQGVEHAVVSTLARARGVSADEIAARSSLPFATVAAVLGRLDLAGRARESAGGWTLIEKKCL
ncbi:hypothetical protein [Leifsonia xyli]|uniref:DprA-like winged helix domain-containing protein n=1 Tax=Leifsonia xyli TaxID=1575 RepID=UPI003D671E9E